MKWSAQMKITSTKKTERRNPKKAKKQNLVKHSQAREKKKHIHEDEWRKVSGNVNWLY